MPSEEYRVLREYLLHRLAPEQRAEVRQKLFTDARLFELAREVENDLIDAFAAGKLTGEEAEAVAELIAAAGDQERVDFAKALAPQAGNRSPGGLRRAGRLAFWFAAAAAFGFAISSAILLIALHRLQNEVALGQRASSRPGGPIAVFSLKPVLRGSDGGQMVLAVPANASMLNLRVVEEPGFARYDMSLRDAFGNIVWSESSPDRNPLELLIPAAVLRGGRYELTVDGERGNAPPDRIEDRDVDIARQ